MTKSAARMTTLASSPPGPDRGRRLAGAWRMASQAFRAGRNRLEPTVAGRVWKELSELGFITRSLEFAAVFTLGFIPFLMVLSVALRSDLTRAVVRPEFPESCIG